MIEMWSDGRLIGFCDFVTHESDIVPESLDWPEPVYVQRFQVENFRPAEVDDFEAVTTPIVRKWLPGGGFVPGSTEG